MKKLDHKIRIKDIATLAGVSEGTVDRVLHNRGEVSAKSREAVTRVLEEMNYTPNLFARSLASKKQYRFVCLFPSYQPGEYWKSIENGFDLAASDFLHHNVRIEKIYFDQFDVNSFVYVSERILKSEPDAVIVAPIFKNETYAFTNKLVEQKIPFSFIDSMIEEADFQTYYGQNSFQSGYIAAKLSLSPLIEKDQVLVVRNNRRGAVSNQTENRYKGFMQYIYDNGLTDCIALVYIEMQEDDEVSNLEALRRIFDENPNIKAAVTFNSKVYRLAKHLDSLNQANVRLIGYDLLEQNVSYLQKGIISYLISHRPDKQAYFTVRDMCRKLIFKQDITKINYVPIDILIKENIEYYLNFKE